MLVGPGCIGSASGTYQEDPDNQIDNVLEGEA